MVELYCSIDNVKERVLVDPSDASYDTKINLVISEAGRSIVDIMLMPYTTVPLASPDSAVASFTADFAASIFKRRYAPDEVKLRGTLQPDGLNDVDATGYFAIGLSKIERYIKAKYTLAQQVGNILHNPDLYTKMAKDGLITFQEARKLINDSTGAIIAKLEADIRQEDISRNLNETATKSLTSTENKTTTEKIVVVDTKIVNHSKAQKRFKVVESNPDTDYYQTQEKAIVDDVEAGN